MKYKVQSDKTPELFTGTFDECWNYLLQTFGTMTVYNLTKMGIKIVPKE